MRQWLQDALNEQALFYSGYIVELNRLQVLGNKLFLPHSASGFVTVNHPGGERRSRITILSHGRMLEAIALGLFPVAGLFKKGKIDKKNGNVELLAVVDGIEIMVTGNPSEVPEQTQSPTEEDVQHA